MIFLFFYLVFPDKKNQIPKILPMKVFVPLKCRGYIVLPEQKSTWGHIILIHKSYNEIVDKIKFISPKKGQKWNFTFWGEAVSHFYFKEWWRLTKNQSLIFFGQGSNWPFAICNLRSVLAVCDFFFLHFF